MKIEPEAANDQREKAMEQFGEEKIKKLEAGWVFPESEPKKEILLAPKSDDEIMVGVQETATWCGSKYWKQEEIVHLELTEAEEEGLYSEASLFLSFRLKKSKSD